MDRLASAPHKSACFETHKDERKGDYKQYNHSILMITAIPW